MGGGALSRRIAFINEKGGSAKTTLVANLAAHLALHRGRRVLALDMDPQGQLARALGTELGAGGPSAVELLLDEILDDASLDRSGPARGVLPRVPTRIRGLDLIGANKALGLAGALDPAGDEATAKLSRALDTLFEGDDYDLLLIDAPPSFGPLTLNVLRAVREVVIPVPLTWLGLDGCAALLRTIETVRTRYGNPGLRISMVIPTFYRRTRMAHELLERLKARFPKELAHTVLGYHVKIDEAQSRGQSVVEYAPADRASKAFAALAEELELRAPDAGGSA
jgi:chromosome partitioning protein